MLTKRLIAIHLVAFASCVGSVPIFGQQVTAATDPILDASAHLLTIGFTPTRDGLSILATLRGEHDPASIPLFERILARNEKETAYFAAIALPVVSKKPETLNVDRALNPPDPQLLGPALALLLDSAELSNEQLVKIFRLAADPAQKVLVAAQLAKRKALPNREELVEFATAHYKDLVRFHAAVTMIETGSEAEVQQALGILKELSSRQDPRVAPFQGLTLTRIARDKIQKTAPWLQSLAEDKDTDEGIRRSAVSVLFQLKSPIAPTMFALLASQQTQTVQQIKLGLIAMEFADQIKPSQLAALEANKSRLVRSIVTVARQASENRDSTAALIKLLQEGHPIMLDWALGYSESADADRKIAIRNLIVENSSIIDQQRGRDFERAVIAAENMAEANTPADRVLLSGYLKSENRAVVEAALAGIARARIRNASELILPVWPTLSKRSDLEQAANFAAIILARENRQEAKPWLIDMVQGATVRTGSISLRALAGWYYAKLTNQIDTLIQLADTRKK